MKKNRKILPMDITLPNLYSQIDKTYGKNAY